MVGSRTVASLATSLVVGILLAGCAPTAGDAARAPSGPPSTSSRPTPSPFPSETPIAPTGETSGDDTWDDGSDVSEDSPPVAAATGVLVVGGDRVVLRNADGSTRGTAMFDDPASVLSLVTSGLGDPHSTTHDTQCGYDIARWDRLFGAPLEIWAQFDPSPGGPTTIVYVNSSVVAGVRVQTASGFAVGDDISASVAAAPAAQRDEIRGQFVWEPVGSSTTGGLATMSRGWVVAGVVSPAALDGSLRAACWGL